MKTIDAAQVLQLLNVSGRTLATAESCTGGWVGKLLTDVPGSSSFYRGGVISYTNEVKHAVLGVPQETLDTFGAVSKQTAEVMAEGVRKIIGADLGAAVTGIAGPDGDGSGRPVGLVYIAVTDGRLTHSRELMLDGDRLSVRRKACEELFSLIATALKVR